MPRLLAKAVTVALWWVIGNASLRIVVDLTSYLTTGTTTGTNVAGILTQPLAMLGALPNIYSALTPDGTVQALLYAETVLGLGLFTWITLMRHGYGNPLNLLRPEHEMPLARQLTPKLRDLGIWVKNDAARGSDQASWTDKIKTKLVRTFRPNADLARALTRRANGILVPYHDEQPAARIFLGSYRHLHLFRRRKYNVYARPEQHVVIFGPSGAGKGATQMNPTLLFWNGDTADSPDGYGSGWPGAIITSTVKSDHVDTALEWRLSLSDQCYIYDPLELYPEYKPFWVGWNPLSGVTTFSEAAAVAAALMESESQQSAGGGGGNEDYFKAQALMVLGPMILSAALAKQPFRTVYDWSLRIESETTDANVIAENGDVDPNSSMYAALEPLVDYAEATGDETPLNQMQQVFTKDPREASGVWGSVRKVLQPYNDEKSVRSTDPTVMPRMFDPRTFYSTPHATLFIVAPEVANEARRMRPVFAAFITWLIEEAQKLSRENNGKLPYPVLANLDEVKNVGAIPGLAHTLSLTRSIGFFVKHAWQDEAQIASAYGKDDAKTITSNSRTWVILPGISDPDHLEALSRLIGERPVKRRKAKATDERDDKARMRAASASMVKEIKDDELLILTDNLPPFVIKATRYFLDSVMNSRYKMGDHRRSTGEMPNPASLRADHSSAERPDLAYSTPGPTLTPALAHTPTRQPHAGQVGPVQGEPAQSGPGATSAGQPAPPPFAPPAGVRPVEPPPFAPPARAAYETHAPSGPAAQTPGSGAPLLRDMLARLEADPEAAATYDELTAPLRERNPGSPLDAPGPSAPDPLGPPPVGLHNSATPPPFPPTEPITDPNTWPTPPLMPGVPGDHTFPTQAPALPPVHPDTPPDPWLSLPDNPSSRLPVDPFTGHDQTPEHTYDPADLRSLANDAAAGPPPTSPTFPALGTPPPPAPSPVNGPDATLADLFGPAGTPAPPSDASSVDPHAPVDPFSGLHQTNDTPATHSPTTTPDVELLGAPMAADSTPAHSGEHVPAPSEPEPEPSLADLFAVETSSSAPSSSARSETPIETPSEPNPVSDRDPTEPNEPAQTTVDQGAPSQTTNGDNETRDTINLNAGTTKPFPSGWQKLT